MQRTGVKSSSMPVRGRIVSRLIGSGLKPAGTAMAKRRTTLAITVITSCWAKPAPTHTRGPRPKGNQACLAISALAGSSNRSGSNAWGQAQLSLFRCVSQGATTSIAPGSRCLSRMSMGQVTSRGRKDTGG